MSTGAPDVSSYYDLTLLDKTPQDLVNQAVADAAAKLPGWVPAEAHIEMTLIEAQALQVAEAIYAINRLPGAVTQILLGLFNIKRGLGNPGTAIALVTVDVTTGFTVPGGSRMQVSVSGIAVPVPMVTVGDLLIPPGSSQGPVTVATVLNTADANGVAAGTTLALVDALPLVDSAVLATTILGGNPVEDDAVYLARGIAELQTLNRTLVRPSHFANAAQAFSGVGRVVALDNYDPAIGPFPGSNPGNVTVAMLDPVGALIPDALKATIQASLASSSIAGLTVHVIDPTITSVNVTATVQSQIGTDPVVVQAAVIAAVQAWMSTAVWPWSTVVHLNSLISIISVVPGVDYVVTISLPTSDITIPGAAAIAQAGVITVTVL